MLITMLARGVGSGGGSWRLSELGFLGLRMGFVGFRRWWTWVLARDGVLSEPRITLIGVMGCDWDSGC